MITLYGIGNCDSCRKALKALGASGLNHHFHDLRRDGLEKTLAAGWLAALGWETPINRKSKSWRALDESLRSDLNEAKALELIMAQPTLIKRPLIDWGDATAPTVGFAAPEAARLARMLDHAREMA